MTQMCESKLGLLKAFTAECTDDTVLTATVVFLKASTGHRSSVHTFHTQGRHTWQQDCCSTVLITSWAKAFSGDWQNLSSSDPIYLLLENYSPLTSEFTCIWDKLDFQAASGTVQWGVSETHGSFTTFLPQCCFPIKILHTIYSISNFIVCIWQISLRMMRTAC